MGTPATLPHRCDRLHARLRGLRARRVTDDAHVPLGAFAIFGALAWMPTDDGDRAASLDPIGAVLVATGSAGLVLPLIQGREAGWPWWTFAMPATAVLAFAALARRQTTSSSPILAPSLLRKAWPWA